MDEVLTYPMKGEVEKSTASMPKQPTSVIVLGREEGNQTETGGRKRATKRRTAKEEAGEGIRKTEEER